MAYKACPAGTEALVDFLTRGDMCLDNCLTNCPEVPLISIILSIKTDHTAVILPAGTNLKPIRCKVQMWDCRENCKAILYTALVEENWDNVLTAPDVQQALCLLKEKIHSHMDKQVCAGQNCIYIITRSAVYDATP